jgi:hypothetical protein
LLLQAVPTAGSAMAGASTLTLISGRLKAVEATLQSLGRADGRNRRSNDLEGVVESGYLSLARRIRPIKAPIRRAKVPT